jgi:hypothetical protein
MVSCMSDEDDKRLRETVLAELERRKRLAREAEDRLAEDPTDAAEERSMPGAAERLTGQPSRNERAVTGF